MRKDLDRLIANLYSIRKIMSFVKLAFLSCYRELLPPGWYISYYGIDVLTLIIVREQYFVDLTNVSAYSDWKSSNKGPKADTI